MIEIGMQVLLLFHDLPSNEDVAVRFFHIFSFCAGQMDFKHIGCF